MGDKRRVLVIEDEYLTALDLTETLEELGFLVCGVARTEEEAVEAAAAQHPDLITADVRLLHGDGISAVNRITAASPVPVVYISSSDADLQERAPRAVRVGKPFDAVMISRAIRTAMSEAPRSE
jgi:two-component system, response regulator PdtaR